MCLSVLLVSCSGLNTSQKREFKDWKASGLAEETKSEGLAAGLNVLPGFGDFYNGNVGLGVVNLLTWPFSILWAPIGGATGAEEVNYYDTKAAITRYEKNKDATLSSLLHAFTTQQISKEQYIFLSNKVKTQSLQEFTKAKEYHEMIGGHEFLRNPANIQQ